MFFKKENRYSGYTETNISSTNSERTVKQVSESELNKLIPDSFEETDWKEVRRYYKLEDGELVFDEEYEPETEDEE